MTVREAAQRLGCNDDKIRRLVRDKVLAVAASPNVATGRAGRRPQFVVLASDVERLRGEELTRLRAVEPCPASCPGRQQQDADGIEEVVRLREQVAELRDALRLSLVIEAARTDQVRLFLAERPPPH
jgi:hypothetical protein